MLDNLRSRFKKCLTFKIGSTYKGLSLTQRRIYIHNDISILSKLVNEHIDSPTIFGKLNFTVPSYNLYAQPVYKTFYSHTQYGSVVAQPS